MSVMESSIKHFDVIVIGSGPGGEGAAIMLAKSGKSVAIVENRFLVGGGCTRITSYNVCYTKLLRMF